MIQLSHLYVLLEKLIQTYVSKVMSLIFNTLSRYVRAFLPRSKCLLILWLQSPSTVLLEPKKIKSVTISIFSPSTFHEAMKLDAMILDFLMLNFKPTFSLSFFTFIKRLLVLLCFLPFGWCHLHIWDVSRNSQTFYSTLPSKGTAVFIFM